MWRGFTILPSVIEQVMTCRVCGASTLTPFFDLGEQPFANALLKNEADPDPRYPLALLFCENCSLVQLTHRASERELFSNYVWVSGTSSTIHAWSETFCDELLKRTENPTDGYVLEIASNDGTMLQPFAKRGHTVLGIDPAQNIAAIAEREGIPTKAVFFGKKAAESLVAERGPANIVFARNVLPHVSDQRDFTEGLAHALEKNGTLALEFHYAGVILADLHYDSVYHEHHCYFSLKSVERLLNEFGLFAFDIMQSPINAGNVILYLRKGKGAESEALRSYRAAEERDGVNRLDLWRRFAERAGKHRESLRVSVSKLRQEGKSIAGYGASARSSTMLNFCGIDKSVLPLIADKSPLKQGLYTPGTHIKIVSPKEMLSSAPDVIMLLAWNFKDEIVADLREAFGYRGAFLIPFPTVSIE